MVQSVYLLDQIHFQVESHHVVIKYNLGYVLHILASSPSILTNINNKYYSLKTYEEKMNRIQ